MRTTLLIFLLALSPLITLSQHQENIRFISDTLVLKGTITYPEGEGPFPAAVFVHGSGPNDRDQRIILNNSRSECLYPELHGDTLQNFKEIADLLADKGIASLRYDKQTLLYEDKLKLANIDPGDFIRDAHAALDFVKTRSAIDDDRLLLLGHSQGGNFLPLITESRKDVQGIITLATPSRSIDTLLANQIKHVFQQCKDSTTAILKYEKIIQAFERLRSGNWPEGQPLMNAYPNFWEDWLAITDSTVSAYRDTKVPVLFLSGTRDYNVPPSHMQRFREAINRENASFQLLSGVTHYLTSMEDPQLSPKVSSALTKWLEKEGFID